MSEVERSVPGDERRLTVCTDGASRGNPGPAGAGAMAVSPSGEIVAEVSRYLGETTNNVAEYMALILILDEVRAHEYRHLVVYTDSKLMANQVTGGYKVKSPGLKPLVARVKALFGEYRTVEVQYIPREKNTECDALANRAIDAGLGGLQEPLGIAGEEPLF